MANIVPALTYGIEEEFFLIDPETRRLCDDRSRQLLAACRSRFGERVGEEMNTCQLEVSTPILHTATMARESMTELRSEVDRIAQRFDVRLLAAGTHPLGDWREEQQQPKARYERLITDYRMIGRRNLLCGLHVHVGIPAGVDRVELMNRLLPWVPLFLALSTSSPFWNGTRTGLKSYRQAAYDEWPRSGTPDMFDDEAQYFGFVDLLRKHEAIEDASDLWWTIRPSNRFPTLELRIADACTRVEDSLALAAAFRCLVRAHLRLPQLGATRTPLTRRLIDENRWRAKRLGTQATFIDETRNDALSIEAMLQALRTLIAPDAETLRCTGEIDRLDAILAEGTSADRQLAIYRRQRDLMKSRRHAMQSVVDWLADATNALPAGQFRSVHGGSGVVNA